MIRNVLLYLIIILAGCFTSCQRDDQDTSEVIDVIVEDTDKFFDTNIIGKVQDTQGFDLGDVKVSLGSQADFTSGNGVFLFNNVKTNSAGSLLKLSKAGYFDQYIFVTKDAEQYTNLQTTLKQKSNAITFSSADPKEIKINDRIILQIPSFAFVDKNGNSHIGQVHCYVNEGVVHGNMPFIDLHLGKGILTKGNSLQFVFEAQDKSILKVSKPLLLTTTSVGYKVAKLDNAKGKWIEKVPVSIDKPSQTLIQSDEPLMIGQKEKLTKVKTRIVSPGGEGVSFTQLEVSTFDENWVFTPDQNGYISFYAPIQTNLILKVKSFSGQTMGQKTITTGDESEKIEVPIPLSDSDLIAVKSDILSCDAPISNQDLVNISLTSGQKTIHIYQSQNSQTFVMPFFHKIEKAMYYRGKQPKFSISFSGYQSQKIVEINAAPLCMEKISGFVNINDMPRFFDKNQYSIFREFQAVETLTISDVSGFLISIPQVNGTGTYKPDAIIFNHPQITDCIGPECKDITVHIDTYSKPGEPVKVRLEGMIGNKRIKGEFVNILKN
jgi:hypothetical protein